MIRTFFLIFTFIPLLSFSQDTTRTKINLSLNYSNSSGNIDRTIFGARMDLVSGKKTEFSFTPSWTYGTKTQNKVVAENEILYNVSLHFRGNGNGKGKGKLMFFHDMERSNLRKIDMRTDAGIGVGFRLIGKKNLTLDLSEAILGEILDLRSPLWEELKSIRMSTRIKLKYKGKFNLLFVGFIQPAVAQNPNIIPLGDNMILRSLLTIDHPIGKSLSLGTTWNFVHQGFVPMVDPTLKSWDSNIQISLRWGISL